MQNFLTLLNQLTSQSNRILEDVVRKGQMLTWGIPVKRDRLIVNIKAKHEQVIPANNILDLETYSINGLISEFAYYSLKSRFNPKQGGYLSIEQEQGVVINNSGIKFRRTTIDTATFIPMTQNSVLGIHFNGGIFNSQEKQIQTFEQEQFFLGGTYSIRGYNETTYPFSGYKKLLFNIEFRKDFFKKLQWVLFYDCGDAFNNYKNISMNQFHFGYGVGIRYFTPVGPIRFDFARNETGGYRLHFGLGQLF